MTKKTWTGKTYAEAYCKVLGDVFDKPEYRARPRGMEIREVTNTTMIVKNPLSNVFDNEVRGVNRRYCSAEIVWYFSGDKTPNWIKKYSWFWDGLKDESGEINSNYGYLMFHKTNPAGFTEWDWCYKSLFDDIDSRQAIMHFNQPIHAVAGVKDFPCTVYGQFMVRDNALNFHVYMRSNDLIKGLTYDATTFMLMQQQMWKLLKESKYPDLKLGQYYHNATSSHIYESDFETVGKMLEQTFYSASLPLIGIDLLDEVESGFHEPNPLLKDIMAGSFDRDACPDPLLCYLNENVNSKAKKD